jgi:hypothetical protein
MIAADSPSGQAQAEDAKIAQVLSLLETPVWYNVVEDKTA